jgi:hypothetical protein
LVFHLGGPAASRLSRLKHGFCARPRRVFESFVSKRDRDLSFQGRVTTSQLPRRAAVAYSIGAFRLTPPRRSKQSRYHSALGSARETLACLEVAVVSSHIGQDRAVHDQLDRIIGTLVKLVAK